MSALPSPLKSPTFTSTQVAAVLHAVHGAVTKEAPVDSPTHHIPVVGSRPIMSALPSPLKSPTITLVQWTALDQVAHTEVAPFVVLTHHWPVDASRPARSDTPSPLKSPVRASVIWEPELRFPIRLLEKELAAWEPALLPRTMEIGPPVEVGVEDMGPRTKGCRGVVGGGATPLTVTAAV